VFDQAAQPGMMHHLGGGGHTVATCDVLVGEHGLEQHLQVRVRNRAHDAHQLGEHLVGIALGGGEEIALVHFVVRKPLQLVDGELRPVLVHLQDALHADEVVAVESVHHLGDVIPHLGVHFAALIAQGERQVWFAGLLLPDFLGTHQEAPLHYLVGCQFADVRGFHRAINPSNYWAS